VVTLCANKLKALADRRRLRIVRSLMHGPKQVGELGMELGIESCNVRHHVRVLRRAGIVTTEQSGTTLLCKLTGSHSRVIEMGCCRVEFISDDQRGRLDLAQIDHR
jgi:DNA-binding transcriptional ArsR family regulator